MGTQRQAIKNTGSHKGPLSTSAFGLSPSPPTKRQPINKMAAANFALEPEMVRVLKKDDTYSIVVGLRTMYPDGVVQDKLVFTAEVNPDGEIEHNVGVPQQMDVVHDIGGPHAQVTIGGNQYVVPLTSVIGDFEVANAWRANLG